MALGRIDHIDLIVEDLTTAEEYFTTKLGFKLLRRTDHAGKSIELQSPAGDFFFDLHQGTEELYKEEREQPGGRCHFGHVAFRVRDIEKEMKDLKAKGVKLTREAPYDHPITGRRIVGVSDADGRFWLQLTENK